MNDTDTTRDATKPNGLDTSAFDEAVESPRYEGAEEDEEE